MDAQADFNKPTDSAYGASQDTPALSSPLSPSSPSSPSPSAWRTYVHLYLPLVTVFLFMTLGTPFESTLTNVFLVVFSALPTYWLGSFIYPTDRADPSPEQAARFTRKKDVYRAAVLFTYRWLFGTPFNLSFFIADFLMSYGIGTLIGERPAGTKKRRSEFGVALLYVAGSAVLMQYAPSTLSYWVTVADRAIWRAAYIALVDDIVGVLARPNVKTWRGKITLVFIQSLTITSLCWLLLSWKRDMILAYREDFFAHDAEPEPVEGEVEVEVEDDGDRFLV